MPDNPVVQKLEPFLVGHLNAQVEVSLPVLQNNSQFALSWILANIIASNNDRTDITFIDPMISKIPLRSLVVSFMCTDSNIIPPALPSRSFLSNEGRQIIKIFNLLLSSRAKSDADDQNFFNSLLLPVAHQMLSNDIPYASFQSGKKEIIMTIKFLDNNTNTPDAFKRPLDEAF